jgi:hypothetical protein
VLSRFPVFHSSWLILGVPSAIVIPLGTWFLARRKTITVPTANAAVIDAAANKPVELFKVGS